MPVFFFGVRDTLKCFIIIYQKKANEAIRYLEYCIETLNSQDQSVHNNLLTLYLQQKPEKLLEYVKSRNVSFISIMCWNNI